ncbi:MAG: cupin domain-containing protein [Rubrivivax sp.]|nr:cupin domain-containing protein [Rubrivivax sp.]
MTTSSPASFAITPAGQSRTGPVLAVGPDTCRVMVAAADTASALSVLEWHGRSPGGPPLHLHPDQDEVFMVDEGDYLFQCGQTQHRLKAGDTIFLPRNVPHTFSQLGATGRLRFLYTPAGDMESFFVALSRLDLPPEPAQAQAVFEAHGMQVVGPPLPGG